jgi:hypothetical protein
MMFFSIFFFPASKVSPRGVPWKATVETFPAGSRWVLQRLAELASTGRAIDCVMKEVSKAAVAAALRVTNNKGTIKTRKNSPSSPKKCSRSISLSHLTISPGLPQPLPQCLPQPLASCLSQSLAQRLSHVQPLAPCLSQPLARHLSQPLPQPLSRHAPKQPQFLWQPGCCVAPFAAPRATPPAAAALCAVPPANPLRRASRSPSRGASRSLLRDASSNPLRSRSRNMRRRSRIFSGSPLSGSSRKRRHSEIHHTSPRSS